MPKKPAALLLTLIFIFVLSACNLPRAPRGTPTPDAVTQAAQTVAAQLTQLALLSTQTPLASPTVGASPTTSVPTATLAPTRAPVYTPCDWAQFVSDITIPDGTKFAPGATFTKTWRLKNIGSCTWTTAYALIFSNGDAMGGPTSVSLPGSVAPGQTIDISVNLTAPATNGKYTGNWKLRNSSGATFGIGNNAGGEFYVQIEVVAPTVTPTITVTSPPPGSQLIYDFAANYCSAQWTSAAGSLPCPGVNTDANGFIVRVDNPTLQNGSAYSGNSIETHPQWTDSGVITGRFPALVIQSGDHFRAIIGCLNGGSSCDVVYQLNYRADGGALQSLGQWNMAYASVPQELDVDMSFLSGKSVEVVLAVLANGSSGQDWAVWVNPRVIK
ncbi:MAG: hypothetical protein GYA17_11335 [Chloroflexi bacterium]|jgi:hypothetical protein|nr:NBR1-Ig-like domain-containing protein [Anaerolineaceae bacterium]NMB88945.1 hypothetical protein [Chloroflexota bacterium]